MTRKRVTASEKKQRHEWAVRQIDAGMGLSELTAFTAETWRCSRRQARDVVAAAHKDWLDACYGSEEIDTAWNLDGCKEDFSHHVVSVVDPSDLLPLKAVAVKEQALALIVGSGKQWTIKDISQAINCNHEHARRTLQSLMSEHQIARRKLPSTGGRPLYAYTEKDFSYTPNTPPH